MKKLVIEARRNHQDDLDPSLAVVHRKIRSGYLLQAFKCYFFLECEAFCINYSIQLVNFVE